MKRKTAIILFITIISLFYCAVDAGSAFAQTPNRIGLSLETRGAAQRPPGGTYMTDIEFSNLLKQADALLALNDFNRAFSLLTPYEVYVFGSVDHWTNLARYDWRLCQVYERKSDMINLRFYLKCITDAELQQKPTKHQTQYIETVDNNNVSNGHYYFGAAYLGRDLQVKVWAREKLSILDQSTKPFGRPDPRMKYDGYPGRRYGRTSGF